MTLKIQMVLLLTIGLLAGCGEVVVFGHTMGEKPTAPEVKTAPVVATETAVEPKIHQDAADPRIQRVRDVTLSLTPQAAEKVATDSRFNADALLAAIKSELQSRGLFAVARLDGTGFDATGQANRTAEITLDDYALRPTTNFVLFGSTINVGTLSGHLLLRDEQGNELQTHPIEAEARVSIPESGDAENPLRPVYREFAVAVANSIAGAQVK